MTVNITLLTYGRPELTMQALHTLGKHTDDMSYILTAFDDQARMGTGAARNHVIKLAETCNGRGDYLYLSDNDVCFTPRWLEALVECYEIARSCYHVAALGAYNHPYNPPFRRWPVFSRALGHTVEIGEVHALALQSWLWKWEDWDRFGPFDITPVGRVRMSEDFAVSQRIREAGLRVASVYPPLIYNTGVTDSFGEPIPGAELVERPEGVVVL